MENQNVPTAEELAAEQAGLVIPEEDEVRAKVVSEYGFDETADQEKIDKLVAREIDQAKKISAAIGAKVKQREARIAAESKIPKEAKAGEAKSELASEDIIYLSKADIHEDDMKEVVNYAKKMGVGVKEAHAFFKPILKERAEQRKTAEVTNTGSSRRSVTKPSDADLLKKAQEGDLPEDPEEIARIMRAKSGAKK